MYYFDDPRNVKVTGVSHGLFRLFLLNGLIPSLTEYLTSRTRAKKFYVDADTYHAQMAEFCLKQILGTDQYAVFFIELHKRSFEQRTSGIKLGNTGNFI